jgi:5S rRNA maturation endonuclease (ribonuclease M5)
MPKKTLYLSTDGAGQIPIEYLKSVKEVVIAFDRDRAGQEMTERIKTQLPNAVSKTPSSIDWNQDLVNTFDWANKNRSQEIKQQQRGIERGGGLSL